jgi:hypothetical protein
MSLRTTPATRFDSFHVHKTSYKRIGQHDIEVNILVPKGTTPGNCPVMVKWHGGGLVSLLLLLLSLSIEESRVLKSSLGTCIIRR